MKCEIHQQPRCFLRSGSFHEVEATLLMANVSVDTGIVWRVLRPGLRVSGQYSSKPRLRNLHASQEAMTVTANPATTAGRYRTFFAVFSLAQRFQRKVSRPGNKRQKYRT